MPHDTPNPKDAEEHLRPFLSDVFETTDACLGHTVRGEQPPYKLLVAQLRATNAALDQTLALLGVRQ